MQNGFTGLGLRRRKRVSERKSEDTTEQNNGSNLHVFGPLLRQQDWFAGMDILTV